MTPELLLHRDSSCTAMMPHKPFRQTALTPSACDPHLVFLHDPQSPTAEQYRRMVSRIVSSHPAGGTLMITSPAPEDGKTLNAINLAFCLAERAPTLLVDMDTRHSGVQRRLGLTPASSSIEDALLEITSPESCMMSIAGTGLAVALNRGEGHSMVELMSAGRPARFLEWAMQRFAWVVFDTPPAFPIADTLEIAQHATVGMLVVRARKTPSRLCRQAIDALKGRLQYVMFNDAEPPNYAVYNHSFYFEPRPHELRR